jgi:hypothetical protein
VTARGRIVSIAAAGLVLPLASVLAAAQPSPLAQAKPRIIQIPEPPKSDPKRHVRQPQKQPEAKPAPLQTPATPSLRAPVQTKSGRKIWI